MLQLLQITEFRQNLRTHLNTVRDLTKRQIFQLGDKEGPYVMAPETLRALEERHAVNCWIKERFSALHLKKYTTLSGGIKTEELPLDMLLGLTDLFGLVSELCEVLAHPGVKENACLWNIENYLSIWESRQPLATHGKFDKVHSILYYLMEKDCPYPTDRPVTIFDFFTTLQQWVEQEDTSPYRKELELTKEQQQLSNCIIKLTCDWILELLKFQTIFSPNKELVVLKFHTFYTWYESDVRPLPNLFHYEE